MTCFNNFSNRRYSSGFFAFAGFVFSSALSFCFDIRVTPSPGRKSVSCRSRNQVLFENALRQRIRTDCVAVVQHATKYFLKTLCVS